MKRPQAQQILLDIKAELNRRGPVNPENKNKIKNGHAWKTMGTYVENNVCR